MAGGGIIRTLLFTKKQDQPVSGAGARAFRHPQGARMHDEATTKDFGPIRDDYEFFVEHATETAEDLSAYRRELQRLPRDGRRLAMLDFGCGDGRFTQLLLNQCLSDDQLDLSLVEPQPAYRDAAAARLQRYSHHRLHAWSSLTEAMDERFDLIVANHSLYYVPDLQQSVTGLLNVLADDGLFVAAMAGRENRLIQFWIRCFAMLERPVPYHLAEDLEDSLRKAGQSWQAEPVQYNLRFPDSEENRSAVLRFLLGEYFPQLPKQDVLDLFQPWADADEIVMPITHRHFIVAR